MSSNNVGFCGEGNANEYLQHEEEENATFWLVKASYHEFRTFLKMIHSNRFL